MHRASFPVSPGPRLPRRLALALYTAWLLLPAGCAQSRLMTASTPAAVRGQAPAELPLPRAEAPPAAPAEAAAVPPAPAAKALPINLDTVLRLAQDQNGQVSIARAKLDEAFAQKDVAALAWLPDLWVGTSYYRHEGGIQNEDGTLTHSSFGSLFGGTELRGRFDLREAVFQKVDAARKVWQQKGELSKLTSENLLDAANTYVDLLAARAGEAISLQTVGQLQDLLKKAEGLAKIEPGAEVEVTRIQAETTAEQQLVRKFREGAKGAAAKLLYLLGLDPCAELVLMDRQLLPFQLVDATQPVAKLVEQAVSNGPGVRELEGLLNLIHEASAKAGGLAMLMPTIDVRLAEGIFGTGPGSTSNWDNRFDLALQARWNLTPLVTARDRRRVAQAKIQQAHLSYQDLRSKLTMGVHEAYEATQSGHDRMGLGEQQIRYADRAYDQSKSRLENKVKGYSYSEVLLAIRSLGGAQLTYLTAVRDQGKAQLRLMVLLGLGSERCHP